eukprot:4936493-Amphidinium_carterae.1
MPVILVVFSASRRPRVLVEADGSALLVPACPEQLPQVPIKNLTTNGPWPTLQISWPTLQIS